jgi:hypothetical protein
MNKEFVPYEEALALKELGFDKFCLKYENSNERQLYFYEYEYFKSDNQDLTDFIRIPTYSQAFRWFREKHKLSGIPTHQSYDIYNIETGECIIEVYPLDSYEEAELACLRKLIEIVKGGNK